MEGQSEAKQEKVLKDSELSEVAHLNEMMSKTELKAENELTQMSKTTIRSEVKTDESKDNRNVKTGYVKDTPSGWERSETGMITARRIIFKPEDETLAKEIHKKFIDVLEHELFIPGPIISKTDIASEEVDKLQCDECTSSSTTNGEIEFRIQKIRSKIKKLGPRRGSVKARQNANKDSPGEDPCTSTETASTSAVTTNTGVGRPTSSTERPLVNHNTNNNVDYTLTTKAKFQDTPSVIRAYTFNESFVELVDAMSVLVENSDPVELIYKLLTVQHDIIYRSQNDNDIETDPYKKLTPEELINTLQRLIDDLNEFLESVEHINTARQKVNYWILLGRIYMYLPNLHAKMIEGIERAARLDPTRHEPWNMLGDFYYYKRNNLTMARSCYENGAAAYFNAVSLRMLALVELKCVETMVGLSPTDKKKALRRSVIYAEQSVLSKFDDGKSWMILGNTYLTSHFSGNPELEYPRNALSCYLRTERSLLSYITPELYFNKYIALTYLEHFYDSICALDVAKQMHPFWIIPRLRRKHIKKYLQVLNDNSAYYGNLQRKKIAQMKRVLREKGLTLISNFLGTPCTLEELKPNNNPGCIIYGKVIWSLSPDYIFPYTFGMLDVKGNSFVVTVFNLQKEKHFVIGDNIAITNPNVTHYNFTFGKGNHQVKFSKIRVMFPVELILNGLAIPKTYINTGAL